MFGIGTTIKIRATGERFVIFARYASPFGPSWLVRRENGDIMAVREADIEIAN